MDTNHSHIDSDDPGPETPLDRLEDRISREEHWLVARADEFGWSMAELAKHLRQEFSPGVYAEPDLPPWPLEKTPAGTCAKIELMSTRISMGRRPYHPLDPIYASDDRKYVEADRQQNGRDVNRRERWLWEQEEEEDATYVDFDAIARRWLMPRQETPDETRRRGA